MIEKGYHYLTCLFPQDLPTPVIALVVALACFLPFLPSLRSSSSTTTSKPVEKTVEKTEKTEWTSFKWPPSQSPQQIPENTVNVCLPFILCFCQWWLLPGDQLSLLFLFQPTTTLLSPLMPHPVLPYPSPQPCWELYLPISVQGDGLNTCLKCSLWYRDYKDKYFPLLCASLFIRQLFLLWWTQIQWSNWHQLDFWPHDWVWQNKKIRAEKFVIIVIDDWHLTCDSSCLLSSITWLIMLEPCFYHNFEAFEKWHLAECYHTLVR